MKVSAIHKMIAILLFKLMGKPSLFMSEKDGHLEIYTMNMMALAPEKL